MSELTKSWLDAQIVPLFREDIVPELICSVLQDEDLSDIAAKQYYIEYGREMIIDRLLDLLPSYLPENQLLVNRGSADKQRASERWATMIQHSHRNVRFIASDCNGV